MRFIAIVEDDDTDAALLSEFIERFARETGQELHIERFYNPTELLSGYTAKWAVVFMDIQMPQQNGMKAAEELRKMDKTVSLVFITHLVQYAQKGYEVDAVAYVIKPVKYYDFTLKFRKALDLYSTNEKHDFILSTSEGMCRISTDKLIYVEIISHRLYYHMVDGVIERTGVLSRVEDELKEFGFLRCHQCYLVNPKFILSIEGQYVNLGAESIAISRPRKKAFMAELANWYAGTEVNK